MKASRIKILTFLLTVWSLTACGNPQAVSSGTDKEYIVGLDETFAPMGFRDDQNNIVGFDVDLAMAVAERIGIELTFQPIDWAMKETELNSGNIDMIWNGYAKTPEREEKALLSEPYLFDSQMIVVRKGSAIEQKSDLAGKLLSTQQSSSSIDKIKADPSGIYDQLGDELVLYPTNNNAFMDLEAGRVDAIVVGESYGRYYIKESNKEDKFNFLTDNFGEEAITVALRKDESELKQNIDAAIADMQADGSYEEIYQKWFFSE